MQSPLCRASTMCTRRAQITKRNWTAPTLKYLNSLLMVNWCFSCESVVSKRNSFPFNFLFCFSLCLCMSYKCIQSVYYLSKLICLALIVGERDLKAFWHLPLLPYLTRVWVKKYSVMMWVCVPSTVAPILISSRNYVLEMAMKSSLVSLFLIPVFYFCLPYSLFSNSFPFGFFSFLIATECV